jgi:hypothetical protein
LCNDRVSLPKSFLAVNLSDAFSFQEKQSSQPDGTAAGLGEDELAMKPLGRAAPQVKDGEGGGGGGDDDAGGAATRAEETDDDNVSLASSTKPPPEGRA